MMNYNIGDKVKVNNPKLATHNRIGRVTYVYSIDDTIEVELDPISGKPWNQSITIHRKNIEKYDGVNNDNKVVHGFKVGDRVRVNNPNLVTYGETGTVVHLCDVWDWIGVKIHSKNSTFNFKNCNLDKLTKESEEKTSHFDLYQTNIEELTSSLKNLIFRTGISGMFDNKYSVDELSEYMVESLYMLAKLNHNKD